MNVGFIGLGIMGMPMAKNLLTSGLSLKAFDINPDNIDQIVNYGAIKATSIKEVVHNCDVVMTMLPNGPEVTSVVVNDDGLLNHMKRGTLLIDLSSISPAVTLELHGMLEKRGIRMLDAPVSGAQTKAIDGTLAIMVGGAEKDFQEALPLLQIMGGKVTLVGPSGSGSACKLTNQIIIAVTMAAVSESFMLAKKSGCNLQKVFEAINTGFAGSAVLNSTIPRILSRNFKPGFKIDLHKKDITNAIDAAQTYQAPIPFTEKIMAILQELSSCGEGGSDNSAIAKYYEKLAGELYTD
ncbi:MAG: 2-hydroxy-3-oxopropionate reductase [Sphaerochaetaceae bacterium]|jgi:2-hydroxy-3-oxopropionate reductase|nr:2-hydroxy-3-oxopropionate reductase [Sphaerochaetaceae bacterium]